MRFIRQICILILSLFMTSTMSYASGLTHQELKEKFEKLGVAVAEITPADIEGLMEIHTDRGVLFSAEDGGYFIAGTLYKLNKNGTYDDVIAMRQAPVNAKKIEALSDDMIVYKAPKERYIVTVFTDITCGYCVRLHSQIKQYNDLGITVRYLAFPRQGGTSTVADQMAAIWCTDNPRNALDEAKTHRQIPPRNSHFSRCQTKVEQQYELGRELGVKGTPAIFLPNGMMIGGYLPPAQLLKRLQSM